jgi:hypothetical protein
MIKTGLKLAISLAALFFLTNTFAGARLTCAKGDKLIPYAVPNFANLKVKNNYWTEGCSSATKQSGSCPAGYKKVMNGMSYRCENQHCLSSCPSGQHLQPGNCEKCVSDGCSAKQTYLSGIGCVSQQTMPIAPGAGCDPTKGACPG